MEQINKIEIQGNIGNVRVQKVGNSEVARISVATNYVFKSKDGTPVIETTWHSVVAWDGRGMPDFGKLTKGCGVHIVGRIRNQKYNDSVGVERQSFEVIANRLEIVEAMQEIQPV